MSLDCVPDTHLVLTVLGIEGIAHEICVTQNLGLVNIVLLEFINVGGRIDLGRVMLRLNGA